ncbi:MAG: hypothetical protein ACM65M_21075 [Microcoleus sp.]|jgi:hypothetical protein
MTNPIVNRRRIDGLKDIAYACNLTNEQARIFGKLSKTSTWEALLKSHNLEYETKSEISHNIVATASQENSHQINFFEWVDFGQLITLTLAGVGLFALLLSLWPRTLNFIPHPVKITIQIGAK